MSGKNKKTCKLYWNYYINYIKDMLILASIISVSTSSFASLGCAPVGISSSAVGIKIFATTLGIKKYK